MPLIGDETAMIPLLAKDMTTSGCAVLQVHCMREYEFDLFPLVIHTKANSAAISQSLPVKSVIVQPAFARWWLCCDYISFANASCQAPVKLLSRIAPES